MRAKFRVSNIVPGEATQPDGTKTKVNERLIFESKTVRVPRRTRTANSIWLSATTPPPGSGGSRGRPPGRP